MSVESSGKPDAWKLARPVWGWGRGVTPRPTPPFARVFGRADWAVMFIVARGGQTYARLQLNVGPGATLVVPVSVDFERPFEASRCSPGSKSIART